MKHAIATTNAPQAVGPYSQAIVAFPASVPGHSTVAHPQTGTGFLFASGQIPLDPTTGELVSDDIVEQAERVLQNVQAVLAANGMTFANVVKSTVFLTDLAHFAAMNAVYAKYFTEPFPARSTIQVAGLPKGARVEIEVVAVA